MFFTINGIQILMTLFLALRFSNMTFIGD